MLDLAKYRLFSEQPKICSSCFHKQIILHPIHAIFRVRAIMAC